MKITTSSKKDIPVIQKLYADARSFQKIKSAVLWPDFSDQFIESEIEKGHQWKIELNTTIACVWTIAFSDAEIWGEKNKKPAIYLHRIATNANYRGHHLLTYIIEWAKKYCKENKLQFVRMDTVGHNDGLIAYYQKAGFTFLGAKPLEHTENLPSHYQKAPVCLFEMEIKNPPR